ncbi:hypothetical protein BH10CYA1_BH10CYA1_59840 [soil metagenome]
MEEGKRNSQRASLQQIGRWILTTLTVASLTGCASTDKVTTETQQTTSETQAPALGEESTKQKTINQDIEVALNRGTLQYHIQSVKQTQSSPYSTYTSEGKSYPQAPAGTTYLQIFYTASNDGKFKIPIDIPFQKPFVVETDDQTRFTPVGHSSDMGLGDTIQPGLKKSNLFALFEMPIGQMKNHPVLRVVDDLNSTKISLSFVQTQLADAHSVPSGAETERNAQKNDNAEDSPETSSTGTSSTITTVESSSGSSSKSEQISGATFSSSTAENANELVDQTLMAQKAGNEADVQEKLERLSKLSKPATGDSMEATRNNKLGLPQLKAGHYGEAVTMFKAASTADPSDAKYLSNLGFAEFNTGDLESSKKHLYSSIALDPTRSVAWGDLAMTLAKQGLRDNAVASLLIGYKISKGDTLGFLKYLSSNEANDHTVREAANLALGKVNASDSQDKSNIDSTSASAGWHAMSCPAYITPQKWQEIQEHYFQALLDDAYCPKIGDTCFIGANDLGWLTQAAKEKRERLMKDELLKDGQGLTLLSNKFVDVSALESNGSLIALHEGNKVKIIEGDWKPIKPSAGIGYFAVVKGGKIQILNGSQAGKSCYSDGVAFKKNYPDELTQFLKTDLEKKAIQTIFTRRSLRRDGDIGLLPEELRQHTLLEQ